MRYGESVVYRVHPMSKKMFSRVTKIDDKTIVTFYENGHAVAVVVENEVIKRLLYQITVTSVRGGGRLLCYIDSEQQVNFTAHENLTVVLFWLRQCKDRLRMPL
jgi:hypothetical protein